MKIELTQRQAQALICASGQKLDELNEQRKKGDLGFAWSILYDDLDESVSSAKDQYYQQLENE